MKYRALLLALGWLLAWASIPANATTATTTATITVFSSIAFSPAFLAFGAQQIGSPVTQVLTVTNGGTAAFSFAVSLTGPQAGQFSFSAPGCNSLAVSASCQISVTFSPTVAASASATITVSGSGRTYNAALSGTGSSVPVAPVPVSIALVPPSAQIPDNSTGGTIVSRATVTMSDGSTNFTGVLKTSNTNYYTISGLNVVLAHGLTPADDGQQNTTISIGP